MATSTVLERVVKLVSNSHLRSGSLSDMIYSHYFMRPSTQALLHCCCCELLFRSSEEWCTNHIVPSVCRLYRTTCVWSWARGRRARGLCQT
jgi:hypothetical protein